VSITLPNNQIVPGVVSYVGTVATTSTSGGSPTIPVVVTPSSTNAIRGLDEAPVEVSITTASVNNVLVVPMDALLARPGGGYVVEEVSANNAEHLVPVTLGLFDDASGVVQVSGRGLAAGQRVVVPSS
jgi:multidrug efflux pump subunit AcrA (membrane-fusion protein)